MREKTQPIKFEDILKRTRKWIDKKYDLLGVPDNVKVRDELFECEMAIFMNQYLFRTFKFEDTRNRLSDAFDRAGIDKFMKK